MFELIPGLYEQQSTPRQSQAPVAARLLPGASTAAGAALTISLPNNGLGIQLFLAAFKGAGKDGSVVLGAEFRGISREAGVERRLEISFVAIDTQDATRVAPPKTLNLPDSGLSASVRYIDRLALPPGRHEVRMAVHQPGGATGSIVAHVEVPDYTRGQLG